MWLNCNLAVNQAQSGSVSDPGITSLSCSKNAESPVLFRNSLCENKRQRELRLLRNSLETPETKFGKNLDWAPSGILRTKSWNDFCNRLDLSWFTTSKESQLISVESRTTVVLRYFCEVEICSLCSRKRGDSMQPAPASPSSLQLCRTSHCST